MKGAAIALVAVVFVCGFALGNPPLKEPIQYEQLCNNLKIAGYGTIDMSTSMLDKRIAMEYHSALSGNGLIEMDQERVYSQAASKITEDIFHGGRNNSSKMNLFESSKVTYSGKIPLAGEKYLLSKEFYGGIGASVKDSFSVNQLEEVQKTTFGTTTTATGAHLMGEDTKGAFNGFWQTDARWHKLFYKDLKSHQSFSGKFEMDRQVKLQEEEPRASSMAVTRTSSLENVKPGDVVTYDYQVKNTGPGAISNLALLDSDLGQIKLDGTMLMPGQTTSGKANHIVTENDLLKGPSDSTATATGTDSFGKTVTASGKSSMAAGVTYYPGGSLISGGKGSMNYTFFQQPLNLTKGNASIYALGVNMTQSRQPAPEFPFKGWNAPTALSQLLFGVTDGQSSVWQNLSLAKGNYSGSQTYGSADGNSSETPLVTWNSTYGGKNPNGGFNCTKDPGYDIFDLKLTVADLSQNKSLGIDSYQRINKSTEPDELAGEWRQIGHQEIPEAGMNKTTLRPFVIVGNMGTTMGGSVSWAKVIAV